MKKRNGLTLIEVLLAMFILSLLLITYITAFGHSAIIVSKGKDITNDTFSHQETMENKIVEGKKSFIENKEKEYKIEIFSNYPYYKTNIDIKKIETKIKGNRKYLAYVTNYEIKEPESPKIEPFSVDVYDKDGNRAFPWYEDDIRIRANFTLKSNPTIFENRIRWYRSKEGIYNPVFSSDYDIVYEEIQKEPSPISYMKELVKTTTESKLLPKRFYYFESRPYTLAGRLEHFRNEDRILVLNRAGSKEWQKFMEDIYFNNSNVKIFTHTPETIYTEVMQNPNHPTLNVDWSANKDPQGSLIGMGPLNSHTSLEVQIDFQVDQSAIVKKNSQLGLGLGLIDTNNTGIMITFDVVNNLIHLKDVENGNYISQPPLRTIKILEDTALSPLLDEENKMDWTKEYTANITYIKNEKLLRLQIIDKNKENASELIEVSLQKNLPDSLYLGFKSYSSLDYKPDNRYEIIGKYDRNYTTHFNDVNFGTGGWVIASKGLFYNGNSHVLSEGSEPNLKIKLIKPNTKLVGNVGKLIAKSFWFAPEIKELELGNNDVLDIEAEEVIFDVPIKFGKDSRIKIKGIDSNSYPVRIYFREGERVTINNGNVITFKKGQYISINSGFVTLKSSNGIINIEENHVQ